MPNGPRSISNAPASLRRVAGSLSQKGESAMATKITGSFTGKVRGQSAVTVAHEGNHLLSLVGVAGVQDSPDPLWKGSRIAYWAMADLVNGSGPQKGYYDNEHLDGGHDWGTFEGKITTSGQQVTMEGTFTITGGSGKYQGITGGGKYKGRFPSALDVAMDWEGEYTLAAAKAAAG
jgi:hypothetical protein